MPALEPYWGKPAVRNLRGDRGNVGIIRSPIRASVLPDREPAVTTATKRTQRLHGVSNEPRNGQVAGAETVGLGRTQHERCRYARHRRPAGVEEHITCKRTASETGRSHV